MILIRPESADHFAGIRAVLTEAFGRSREAELVESLRSQKGILFALTATLDGKVVGYLPVVRARLISEQGEALELAGFGPLAVAKAQRGKGAGARLVTAALEECRQMGIPAAAALGAEDYYARFGFHPAAHFQLGEEADLPGELAVIELRRGILEDKSGLVRFPAEFMGG